MATENINGVKMVSAKVEIDQRELLDAYAKRCTEKIEFARNGAKIDDVPFSVKINGVRKIAYIVYESEDMYGPRIVARYLYDTDDMGDWYDLILIDVDSPGRLGNQVEFSPRQSIRNFGELMAINNNLQLGMAIDASALVRRV